MMDMNSAQNIQIQPLTVRVLEKLQLEVTKAQLEDLLMKANYCVSEGQWNITDFKFVTVRYENNKTHAIYDISLKGDTWEKSDTISLPFETETGELLAVGA